MLYSRKLEQVHERQPLQTVRGTVALFVPALLHGGAEHQALELARLLTASPWRVAIVTLGEGDADLHAAADAHGIRVLTVGKGRSLFETTRRLRSMLEAENITVLHAFLTSTQAYSTLLRISGWDGTILFGVRDSKPLFVNRDLKNIACDIAAFNPFSVADHFVFNSRAGLLSKPVNATHHRSTVIENAIDVSRYRPDRSEASILRCELALPENTVLLGIVANLVPEKDYPLFLDVVCRLLQRMAHLHVVAIGNTDTKLGPAIRALAAACPCSGRITFLGKRTDVDRILPELDVLCSSSRTEGFSNVIGEAMACGVPCVVTDAGDSGNIVGDTGRVVPCGASKALEQALEEVLNLTAEERADLGSRARARVIEKFSGKRMLSQHLALYDRVQAGRSDSRR